MGRSVERSAARKANRRIKEANRGNTKPVIHEHDSDEECSLASDCDIGDSEEEDLDESELDHTFDGDTSPIPMLSATTTTTTTSPDKTRKRTFAVASAATSTTSGYSYPQGIQFVPESKNLLRGNDLLQCTSLGWTDGGSPSVGSIKKSGQECAKDIKRITYDQLTTEVKAKKFPTGMKKQGSNVNIASQKAVSSWGNSKGYRKVFNAIFNGGVGGNNRYGGGKMRMRQTTPGVVLHERLHGDNVGHSNRWRALNDKQMQQFQKMLKRKGGRVPKGYTQINGKWSIFESSRDGFCSVMNIFGKRTYLPVPIMKKIAYKYKQLALYPTDASPMVYNLQDVMKPQREGVLNGVQIMMDGDLDPIYLGKYSGRMPGEDQNTTLLAFHTATGKGNNVGSTRWGLGKNLTFEERGIYARTIEAGPDVWKVEVGRIAPQVEESREVKRLRM